MSVFQTAYDTTTCSGYVLDSIRAKCADALSRSFLPSFKASSIYNEEALSVFLIRGGEVAQDVIPFFHHPILVDLPGLDVKQGLFVDVRPYGAFVPAQNFFRLRNIDEYIWTVKKAALGAAWLINRQEKIRDLSPLPAQVYSTVISQVLTTRFALEIGDQLKIRAAACWFYLSLFSQADDYDEFQRNQMIGRVAQITKIPAGTVYEILGDEPPVWKDLNEFCEGVKNLTGNIRLQKFERGLLIECVSRIWYGNNSAETIAVGLEHPPTWIMIIYGCVGQASFKRSTIFKTVDKYAKQGVGETLLKQIDRVMDPDGELEEFLNPKEKFQLI
jgi:hypothetical protein